MPTWLQLVQALWPVALALLTLITGGGLFWLRAQFATKAELTAATQKAEAAMKAIEDAAEALEKDVGERFERGSRKFADHDKRLAVVEKECEGAPTKADLTQMISVLGGRMSGVESAVRGVERMLSTQHDYLQTVLERASSK